MSDENFNYALTGDASGAKAAFDDVGASIARAGKRVDETAKSVQSIAAKLDAAAAKATKHAIETNKGELAMAGLGEKLSAVNMHLADVGAGIPGAEMAIKALTNPVLLLTGATIGASVAMGKFALDNADLVEHLSNLEATTGLTVDQLYAIREVALGAGVDFEGAAKAVRKMETELGNGSKALKAMGLTGGDATEDLAKVADAYNAATTAAERNRIANAAFGNGFESMIPILREGGDAIRQMGEGSQIDLQKYRNLDESVDGISQAWRDIRFSLGDIAAGPLNVLLSGFREGLELVQETAAGWKQIMNGDRNANVGVAEAFVTQYATQESGVGKRRRQAGLSEITAANSERLLADLAAQPLEERARILDGLNNLTRENATIAKLLLDASGNLKGVNVADLGKIARQTALEKKAPPPESQDEIDAREKAAQKELEFQRDLDRQIEEMTATADQRELIAIKNKYEKLLEQHKAYGESRLRIQQAKDAELQAYYMKQNFAGLAGERDQEQITTNFADQQARRSFQNPWESNDEARAARKMQQYGLIGENGVGVFDATQMDLSEMNEAIANYEAGLDEATIKSIQASAEMQEAWQGVSESIAGTIASNLAPALLDAFTRPQDALEQLGEAGTKILADLATQLLEVGIKWALLSMIAGGTGGEGPGGFVKFLTKSFGGHADGTLSSPGGLKYLGEQGPEMVTTPLGARYMASYGLYQVPAGTRVEKSQQQPRPIFAPQITISNPDPNQAAEIAVRRMREEFATWMDGEYRTRQS